MDSPFQNSPSATILNIDTPNLSFNELSNLSSPNKQRTKTVIERIPNKVIEEANAEEEVPSENPDLHPGYFMADKEEVIDPKETITKKSLNMMDNNPYDSYFKLGVFIKFFIMHALYFFLVGPLIIVFAPVFGRHVLVNQNFISRTRVCLNQTWQYIAIVFFLTAYYGIETPGLQAMEVYMMCIALFVRFLTIASKYAYQSERFLKLFQTTFLKPEQRSLNQMLAEWRQQTDEIIEDEVRASILRLEIDSSLFFFSFLGKISPDLQEQLSKQTLKDEPKKEEVPFLPPVQASTDRQPVSFSKDPSHDNFLMIPDSYKETTTRRRSEDGYNSKEIDEHEPSPLHPHPKIKATKTRKEKMNKDGGSTKTSLTSRLTRSFTSQEILKSFSTFLKAKKLEENHLYGYNLATMMLQNARKARPNHLGKTILAVSILRAMLPTIYRVYLVVHDKKDIEVFTNRPYIVIILFMINTFFFWANSFIIAVSVLDLSSKISCLKQIGYLISPKKLSHFQDRKLYPTYNIFDPVTLKTWSNLRKVIGDYGKKYTLRNKFNVTITMIFYLVILAIFALQVFGVVDSYNDPLLIIVFGYEIIFFFSLFVSIMLSGAFINNQYRVHKNLLKKNKTIISDFQRLSYLYVGENAIEPDNYIYKEGLKILRNELGEVNFEKRLVARAEKLTAMIDEIIEELQFEEENEPFTVMGVPTTYSVLKTMGVGAVSLVFALGQSIFNR